MLSLPLLALLFQVSSSSSDVPRSVLAKLARASTFGDLVNRVRIDGLPPVARAFDLKSGPASDDGEFRRLSSSPQLPEETHSLKQGSDTCFLEEICVPLDARSRNHKVVPFPQCAEVKRCVGSCCQRYNSCTPTRKRTVQRKVAELLYTGTDSFSFNGTVLVDVEEHLACACRSCEEGECVAEDSSCDEEKKNECQGGFKVWKEESCSCSRLTRGDFTRRPSSGGNVFSGSGYLSTLSEKRQRGY